jgi:hypothetical protein
MAQRETERAQVSDPRALSEAEQLSFENARELPHLCAMLQYR